MPAQSNAGVLVLSNRRQIYKGALVDLGLEAASLPDGTSFTLEIVRHPGGAAVAAVSPDYRVCVLRQYRHAAGGWIWELPAGKIDAGENPLVTAQRELQEEAGFTAIDWTPLGSMLPSPGFCDELLSLYLARNLSQTATQPERHEFIEVHWLDLDKALQYAADNTYQDAKTVVTLFRAHRLLSRSDIR